MRSPRAAWILVGVILSGALAGCTDTTIHSHPSASSTSTSTSNPAAAPAPTRPALDALVVGPAGLGSVVLGEPVPAEPSRTALVAWHADACEANVAPEGAPPTHGLWITTYPDDPSGPIQQDPFRIATIDAQQGGAVSAVQVFSPQIRTTTGVHIGSSVSELEAAYPGGFADHRHGYDTDVYAVDGPSGRLLIEAYDGSEDAGGRSEVALMSVVPPGTAPFALIPGDGLLGCPV